MNTKTMNGNSEPELLFSTDQDTDKFKNRLKESHIKEAFNGDIRRKGSSIFYMAGMFIITLFMILLPIVYMAVIAAAIYVVFWHATNNFGMVTSIRGDGRAVVLMFMLFLTPVIVGGIIIFFMIKPFFARRMIILDSFPLKHEDAPLLFKFVEVLCNKIGAPVPSTIEVMCDINAGASLRSVWNIFSRKVDLHIGLPLAAGMTMREFAGVLAHEFGHFSQKHGMKMSAIIRTINHWFARVVYERDAWDYRLKVMAKENDIRIGFIFYVAMFFIWLTRIILWILMQISNMLSCFLSRQMEYDADYYMAMVSGSDGVETVMTKLRNLNIAFEGVCYDLDASWMEKRLGDNLPDLIAHKIDELPEEWIKRADEHTQKERTGLFYTHPSTKNRIKQAKKYNAPGIFSLDRKTEELFVDFNKLCKAVTLIFYSNNLGQQMNHAELVSSDTLISKREGLKTEENAMQRYFQNIWNGAFPFTIDTAIVEKPADINVIGEKLIASRKSIMANLVGAKGLMKNYCEDSMHQFMAKVANEILSTRASFNIKSFNLTSKKKEDIDRVISEKGSGMMQSKVFLENVKNQYRERLFYAFQFLYNPNVSSAVRKTDETIDLANVTKMLRAFNKVCFTMSMVDNLNDNFTMLTQLFNVYRDNQTCDALILKIKKYISSCKEDIRKIHTVLNDEQYPFEHGHQNVSMGSFVVGAGTFVDDSEVVNRGERTLRNFYELYFRLLGRLAYMAETIETTINLKQWAPPPQEKQSDSNQ